MLGGGRRGQRAERAGGRGRLAAGRLGPAARRPARLYGGGAVDAAGAIALALGVVAAYPGGVVVCHAPALLHLDRPHRAGDVAPREPAHRAPQHVRVPSAFAPRAGARPPLGLPLTAPQGAPATGRRQPPSP